jgi:hypothetical protein
MYLRITQLFLYKWEHVFLAWSYHLKGALKFFTRKHGFYLLY